METTTAGWQSKRLERRTLLPFVRLSCPMGDRLWGFTTPNVATALVGGLFDGDVFFDANTSFDPGGLYLERSARLISVSGLDQGVRTFDSAVLGSWGQAERVRAIFVASNGDRAMSTMIGREYVMNQVGRVYLSFPVLDITEAMLAREGRVQRWTLTALTLTVELMPQ